MGMRNSASPTGSRSDHEFFLATKTGERTYAPAREQIRRSLDRLGVDHVDSIQLHNLCDVIEWDIALSGGGALEACIEARDEGLVRFIGVTGHGLSIPKMHQRSLGRFDFDSVLCPYNWVQMQDPRYAETFTELAQNGQERNVALQTIKSLAYKPWEGREKTASTWYEPLQDQADIDLAVSWVLADPQVFLLTTGDVDVLPKLLDAAERAGERPSDEQMAGSSWRRCSPSVEQLAHGPQQRVAVERLLQEGAPRRQAAPAVHGVGRVAGHEQGRELEPPRELRARHVGHDHVGHERVDAPRSRRARSRRSAAPRRAPGSRRREHDLHERAHALLVLAEQDRLAAAEPARCAPARGAGPAALRRSRAARSRSSCPGPAPSARARSRPTG